MAQDQDPDTDRLQRADPARKGPIRTGFTPAAGAPPPASEGSAPGPGGGTEPEPPPGVEHVVARAVRLGYDVIGENLRQGRVAADRFSAGAYKPRHAKDDIDQVGQRLLQLARDLGVAWYDLLHAALRDPKLEDVVRPRTPAETADPGNTPIKVGCVVKGNPRATAEPLVLSQPDKPSALVTAGLHSPQPSAAPLKDVTFLASDDGQSIMAVIVVPADQPAGKYSGVVCDAVTHTPLGTLTVKVAG